MMLDQTITLTTVLLGLCFLLCALEYFALPSLAKPLFSLPGWSYLFSTITLWFFPNTFLIWIPPLSIVVTSVFFTRRFNGGSDAVMFWVSLTVGISYNLLSPIPTLITAAILFLGILGTFTYFQAGLSKLFSKSWRNGTALPWSLKQHCYENEIIFPRNKQSISLLIITWELLFPSSLLHPNLALFFLSTGASFHLFNAWALGINRFTFAFICFYPSIYYTSKLNILNL